MSVKLNTYICIGCMFDYKEWKKELEDKMESEVQYKREFMAFDIMEPYFDSAYEGIHHKDDLCILSDGMNGEFVFVGRVFHKTECYQHFGEPVDATKIWKENKHLRKEIPQQIEETFKVKAPKAKLYIIPYYR
jgi:hypothetical protein